MPTTVPFALSLLLALASAGCAARPAGREQPHAVTTTIRLVERALRPASNVTIPTMSQVVFHNDTLRVAMVAIESSACPACAGVVGFAAAAGGVRSAPIPPAGFAALCFHAPGRHAFAFAAAGNDQRGVITVDAAK